MHTSTVRTARKTHRCDGWRCPQRIRPGETYRDYLVYPGDEFMPVDKPTHVRECETCSARENRPIQPEEIRRDAR